MAKHIPCSRFGRRLRTPRDERATRSAESLKAPHLDDPDLEEVQLPLDVRLLPLSQLLELVLGHAEHLLELLVSKVPWHRLRWLWRSL